MVSYTDSMNSHLKKQQKTISYDFSQELLWQIPKSFVFVSLLVCFYFFMIISRPLLNKKQNDLICYELL